MAEAITPALKGVLVLGGYKSGNLRKLFMAFAVNIKTIGLIQKFYQFGHPNMACVPLIDKMHPWLSEGAFLTITHTQKTIGCICLGFMVFYGKTQR